MDAMIWTVENLISWSYFQTRENRKRGDHLVTRCKCRPNCVKTCLSSLAKFTTFLLYDEFIWDIWVISETWLDCSKLTYNTCNCTDKGSKNWSITFKGRKALLLKAILAKTSNFWPIGPIELKFWHLVLKMIHFNISLRRSHGSSFRPLSWV